MWDARRNIDTLTGTRPLLMSDASVDPSHQAGDVPDGWTSWMPSLTPKQAFAALAVFALLLRLVTATGLVGSDDLHYAKYARAVLDGNFTETVDAAPRKHHALRYGVILPLAATYAVFGVSEWTTILLPMLASTLSVLLIAFVARRLFGMRVAIIAGLLYATFPMQLRLAGMLLPEALAGFYVLVGVLLYLFARSKARSWAWLGAGVLMGIAYVAKESALFVGGAFLLHAVWERQWRGAALLAVGVASIVGVEHAYYYAVRGDLLFRPHSTQLYTVNPDAPFFSIPEDTNPPRLMYRLLWKYPEAMLVPDLRFGLHSLFAVVLAAAALLLRPRRKYVMLLLWAIVPFLYLNFGTWNLNRYAPLPTDPRYIELVYPPLLIMAAVVLSRAFERSAAVAKGALAALLVVMVSGVVTGILARDRTADATAMNVLRGIVRAAQVLPPQSIYTEDEEWRRALAVLDPTRLSPTREGAAIILVRHELGFPTVESREMVTEPYHRGGEAER